LTRPEEPAFDEPWQAQVFAMAVTLSEHGVFSWKEWTEAFGAELKGVDREGADAYFRAWLRTLEGLLVDKAVAREGELPALAQAWLAAAAGTPHGQPIVLGAERCLSRSAGEGGSEAAAGSRRG
jgi:nitrile hydratase accessory protein